MSSSAFRNYVPVHCRDDEARTFAYHTDISTSWIKENSININGGLITCSSDLSDLEQGSASIKPAIEIVTKIFTCRVPNWLPGDDNPFDRGSHLSLVWKKIDPHQLSKWCQKMNSIGFLKESNEEPSENSSILADCGRLLDFFGRLDPTIRNGPDNHFPQCTSIYDFVFFSVWHDHLKYARSPVNMQVRPRWKSVLVSNKNELDVPEVIHSVPDLVLSVKVGIDERFSPALRTIIAGDRLECFPIEVANHEGRDILAIDIPILIAEYVRSPAERDQHERHLIYSMTAALKAYTALSVARPIFGLLFQVGLIRLLIGYSEDETIIVRSVSFRGFFEDLTLNLFRKSHCLHLFQFLTNLHYLSEYLQASLQNGLSILPSSLSRTNTTHHCAFSQSLDPCATEDPARAVVCSSSSMKHWFASRDMLLRNPSAEAWLTRSESWGPVREILSLFRTSSIPNSFSDNLRAKCLTVLTARERELWHELSESVRTVNDPYLQRIAAFSEEAESNTFAKHVTRALSLASMARDIDDTQPFSRSMWMSLYSVLFNMVWLDFSTLSNPPFTVLTHAPRWAVHRATNVNVQVPVDLAFENIVVDMVFERAINPLFKNGEFDEYPFASKLKYGPQLSVLRSTSEYTGTRHITYLPLLIVEHVKSCAVESDVKQREKHAAHLAVAMRSALATYKIHAIPATVLGLLCDRSIVTVAVGWFDEDAERDVMIEVPSAVLKYDIRDPVDVLRFRLAVSNHSKIPECLWKEAADSGDISKAAQAFKEGRFPPWKCEETAPPEDQSDEFSDS